MTVLATVIPAIIPVVVGDTESLGVWCIGTVEVIDTTTQSQAVAAIGNLLGKEPLLAELNSLA
jgi:hypothetical protein